MTYMLDGLPNPLEDPDDGYDSDFQIEELHEAGAVRGDELIATLQEVRAEQQELMRRAGTAGLHSGPEGDDDFGEVPDPDEDSYPEPDDFYGPEGDSD